MNTTTLDKDPTLIHRYTNPAAGLGYWSTVTCDWVRDETARS
jgi:hypothetical protein